MFSSFRHGDSAFQAAAYAREKHLDTQLRLHGNFV